MPASRFFGALWGLGLAIAVPLWAFALVAPADGRLAVLLIDAAHHAFIMATCAAAFHFARPAVVAPGRSVGAREAERDHRAGAAGHAPQGPRPLRSLPHPKTGAHPQG